MIDSARDALAAARLADQAQDLAPVDLEVDAVDGADQAVAGVERRAQAPGPPGAAGRRAASLARCGTSSSATVSSRTDRSGLGGSSVQPRVEGVAQAVAEQVEAEHGQGERDARGGRSGAARRRLVALEADHRAPFRRWGCCAPRPRNERAATSRTAAADARGCPHDERGQGVGQDASREDARGRLTERPRRR